MNGYKVTIAESSMELSAKEKVRLKDLSNANRLDQMAGTSNEPFIIKPVMWAVLDVDNEHSPDKKYRKFVIVDADGNKYHTGSESFWTSFMDIFSEMNDAGESDYEIAIYQRESKNYAGKTFLTCSLA